MQLNILQLLNIAIKYIATIKYCNIKYIKMFCFISALGGNIWNYLLSMNQQLGKVIGFPSRTVGMDLFRPSTTGQIYMIKYSN